MLFPVIFLVFITAVWNSRPHENYFIIVLLASIFFFSITVFVAFTDMSFNKKHKIHGYENLWKNLNKVEVMPSLSPKNFKIWKKNTMKNRRGERDTERKIRLDQ